MSNHQALGKVLQMKDSNEIGAVLYLLIVVLSAIHVYRDCRKLGEKPFWNVSGTIVLWPFFYLIGWLWIWPGSLRRKISGGSIDDLIQAKSYRRAAEKKNPTRIQR